MLTEADLNRANATLASIATLTSVLLAWSDFAAADLKILLTPVDRTPGVSQQRPIQLRDMYDLVNLGGMARQGLSVSPNGQHVAFQTHKLDLGRNDYVVNWYVLSLVDLNADPVFVGDGGDPLLFRARAGQRINGAWQSTNPSWSPDGQWLAYRKMVDGSVQVWRSSRDGRVVEKVTHGEADVEAFYWSADGDELWIETDATENDREHHLALKAAGGFWAGDSKFDRALTTIAIVPYELTSGHPRLSIVDLSSGRERDASDAEKQNYFGLNTVSLDELSLRATRRDRMIDRPLSSSVTSSNNGEARAWLEASVDAIHPVTRVHARLDNDDRGVVRCEATECAGHIYGLWWSGSSPRLVFSRGEGSNRTMKSYYTWDIDTDDVRKFYREEYRHLSACSPAVDSLVCFSDQPEYPRTLVELDLSSGSVNELYDPNPWFENVIVGDSELIEWGSGDGVETIGWFVKPIGYEEKKRYPLIIVQYRARSCFKGGTGDEFPAQLFAARGFAVLCFEQPLHWELAEKYGSVEFHKAIWHNYREKSAILSSIESAIALLDQKRLIDPNRVGITGLSSGADTISYALSHSDRFSAAVVANLGWDPTTYFRSPAWSDEIRRQIGFGRPGTPDDRYMVGMSVGMNVEKIRTPILVQVSDGEAWQSMYNYITLRAENKPIDMYVFRDEHHVKWHPQNRQAVAARALDWMRFWLMGEESDDPVRAEELERWRALREQHITNLEAAGKKYTLPLPSETAAVH